MGARERCFPARSHLRSRARHPVWQGRHIWPGGHARRRPRTRPPGGLCPPLARGRLGRSLAPRDQRPRRDQSSQLVRRRPGPETTPRGRGCRVRRRRPGRSFSIPLARPSLPLGIVPPPGRSKSRTEGESRRSTLPGRERHRGRTRGRWREHDAVGELGLSVQVAPAAPHPWRLSPGWRRRPA